MFGRKTEAKGKATHIKLQQKPHAIKIFNSITRDLRFAILTHTQSRARALMLIQHAYMYIVYIHAEKSI